MSVLNLQCRTLTFKQCIVSYYLPEELEIRYAVIGHRLEIALYENNKKLHQINMNVNIAGEELKTAMEEWLVRINEEIYS